jgi:hypothetical protein
MLMLISKEKIMYTAGSALYENEQTRMKLPRPKPPKPEMPPPKRPEPEIPVPNPPKKPK